MLGEADEQAAEDGYLGWQGCVLVGARTGCVCAIGALHCMACIWLPPIRPSVRPARLHLVRQLGESLDIEGLVPSPRSMEVLQQAAIA